MRSEDFKRPTKRSLDRANPPGVARTTPITLPRVWGSGGTIVKGKLDGEYEEDGLFSWQVKRAR
jgi:hypothetical protein